MSHFSPELSAAPTGLTSQAWRVIVYFDSKNSLDEMAVVLESASDIDSELAMRICNVCEEYGRAVCFVGDKQECHRMAETLRSRSLQVEVDDFSSS